jgi:hypothetical protein
MSDCYETYMFQTFVMRMLGQVLGQLNKEINNRC